VEAGVLETLNAFRDGYARRDASAVLATFLPDPEVVCIGTGADEKRLGRAGIKAQVERDLAQTEAISIEFGSRIVSAAGVVAWVTADCALAVTVAGRQATFVGRFTAVLEQRQATWLLAQVHFSLPTGGTVKREA
jgi:ketosteroid isomerase-like protein